MSNVFPQQGRASAELQQLLAEWQTGDIDWKGGRAFSLVYNADDPVLEDLQHRVADRFLHENALNPFAYPSLLRMEQEVVAVAAAQRGHRGGVHWWLSVGLVTAATVVTATPTAVAAAAFGAAAGSGRARTRGGGKLLEGVRDHGGRL